MSEVPVPVEQSKPADAEPAALATVEPTKPDETPAVTETPAAVVEETPAAVTQETPVTEDQKDEAKAAEPEKRPRSPGILARLMGPFNKKTKAPKSPKRKEAETPVTDDAPKAEETPAAEAGAEPPKEVAEPVKETETPATETPAAVAELPKEKEEKKSRFTRRLSARVNDLFKKSKSEVPTPAKVDEDPPRIDEPTPVAPLENPASEAAALAETPAKPSEPAPVEPVIAATPVVAAAAS